MSICVNTPSFTSQDMLSIIFEDINDKYAYGQYGEIKVMIMKKNGYVNATKLCALSKKRFDHWLANKQSKELMNEINKEIPGPDIPGSETLNLSLKLRREIYMKLNLEEHMFIIF